MENDVVNRVAAVVYRKENDGLRFLLTQEASGYFTLPGGGQEEYDVNIVATLERELMEELCISPLDYMVDRTDHTIDFKYQKPTHPRFGMRGRLHGFLVRVNDNVIPKAGDDIKSVNWFSYEDALSTLEHQDNKDMFLLVTKDLK